LLISWAVQCVINARGSSFNDSPSAWLRIRPPLLPAISHAVTLLALVLLTQPRHEHMLAAQALLVLRSVVGVVAIMPNFLAARWSAYEEAASHVWLCSVFVILIWTFPPSGDVRARQRVSPLWWCARTMPAAAACSAAAVRLPAHVHRRHSHVVPAGTTRRYGPAHAELVHPGVQPARRAGRGGIQPSQPTLHVPLVPSRRSHHCTHDGSRRACRHTPPRRQHMRWMQ